MKVAVEIRMPVGDRSEEAIFRGEVVDQDGGRFYVSLSENIYAYSRDDETGDGFSVIFGTDGIEGDTAHQMGTALHFTERDAKVLPSQLRELAEWIEVNLAD